MWAKRGLGVHGLLAHTRGCLDTWLSLTNGMTKDVLIWLGSWKRIMNQHCVPLDDIDLILSNEFFEG